MPFVCKCVLSYLLQLFFLQCCTQVSHVATRPTQHFPNPVQTKRVAGYALAVGGIVALVVAIKAHIELPAFLRLRARRRGSGGRWVRDRTLGGRQVFIPDGQSTRSSVGVLSESPSAAKEREGAYANIIGGTTSAPTPSLESKRAERNHDEAEESMPEWWDPEPQRFRTERQKHEGSERAKTVLKRMVDDKLAGHDFQVDQILQLRDACAESGEPVKVGYSNRRDAIFRAGVEAAFECAENAKNIGGTQPARLITALSFDLQVPLARAKSIVAATEAGLLRSRVLDAVASMRQNDDAEAMLILQRVENALSLVPMHAESSAELEMAAESLAPRLSTAEKANVMKLYNSIADDTSRNAEAALSLCLRK